MGSWRSWPQSRYYLSECDDSFGVDGGVGEGGGQAIGSSSAKSLRTRTTRHGTTEIDCFFSHSECSELNRFVLLASHVRTEKS